MIQVSRRAAESNSTEFSRTEHRDNKLAKPQEVKPANVYLDSDSTVVKHSQVSQQTLKASPNTASTTVQSTSKRRERFKPYCLCCPTNQDHYLNACTEFVKLTTEEKDAWTKDKGKCWKCQRGHRPENCTLKKLCSTCNEQHLTMLHEVAAISKPSVLTVSTPTNVVYLDQASHSGHLMLKVAPVKLCYGRRRPNTHAMLVDESADCVTGSCCSASWCSRRRGAP